MTPFLVLGLDSPHVVAGLCLFYSGFSVFVMGRRLVYAWSRDNPEEHSGVNAAELAHIAPEKQNPAFICRPAGLSGGALLGNRCLLALCVMYCSPTALCSISCITWLPTYLREQYAFTSNALQVFSPGLPLLLSVFGDVLGGVGHGPGHRRGSDCAPGGAASAAAPT